MNRRKSKTATTAYSHQRLSVNIISCLVTCAALLIAVSVADAGFANSIHKITKNLEVAIKDLENDMPNYTDYHSDEKYWSTNAPFYSKAMAGLYNLTIKFMDFVVKPDFLMKDLIIVQDRNIALNQDIGLNEVLKNYWGLLVLIIAVVLITVLLPICGLFFCCCRCCGNCGARSQPSDKKKDVYKKVCQGAFLIILGTALLFCVVCVFASNQQMQDGLDELPENMRNAKKDTVTYLDSTIKEANILCVKNYEDFSTVFKNSTEKAGMHVMQQLSIWSNATAMMDLYAFVETMPKISNDLQTLKDDTNSLRVSASQLNDAMRKVKRDLLGSLGKCPLEQCRDILNNITKLQTNIDFNKLPDVSSTLSKLNDFDIDKLQKAAEEGKKTLDNIETEIKNKLHDTLQRASVQVDDAGLQIKQYLSNVTTTVEDLQKQVNSTDKTIDDVNYYIKYYGQFRNYGFLAISCILLLVAIFIAFGLICGICGKIPDGYSDNCCNKGSGGQFLICAVMLMFFSALLIGAVTLVMLVSGIAVDRVACYPLKNPQQSQVMDVLDELLKKNAPIDDIDLSVKAILDQCHRNESIYKVFNLEKKFDINTIKERFNITRYLDEMTTKLNNIVSKDFTILSPTNEDILKSLSNFNPTINFDQFKDELKENFTNFSLHEISSKLQNLVDNLDDSEVFQQLKREVKLSILHINTYDEKLLIPMKEKATKVMAIAQNLDSSLRMNSTDFPTAINKLLVEIKEAETTLKQKGPEMLRKAASGLGDVIKKQVNSYLDRVINATNDDLGQCGPLSVAINAALISTCDKILLPWNGFWVSLLFSLLLFIPLIIVSVKLASLYQKYKQYGPYVETEYLYDAYADRSDNIPLNSREGKRGAIKNKKKRGKKHEDRPNNIGEVVTREYATGSHPPDSRYADMAPKHWEEFPNGGPPQYQRAPTEYERPPPYYYPGSGDQ